MIPGRGQTFFCTPQCPDRLWVPPSLLFNGYRGYEEFFHLWHKDVWSVESQFALLATCFSLVSCLAYPSTLKMEAICCSETSVDFQRTTPRYIPDHWTLLELLYLFCCGEGKHSFNECAWNALQSAMEYETKLCHDRPLQKNWRLRVDRSY
jgi:hypothetical protein